MNQAFADVLERSNYEDVPECWFIQTAQRSVHISWHLTDVECDHLA